MNESHIVHLFALMISAPFERNSLDWVDAKENETHISQQRNMPWLGCGLRFGEESLPNQRHANLWYHKPRRRGVNDLKELHTGS